MKKILFITPFIPDDHGGGGTVYTRQLLEELAKTCRIDLIYFRYADSAHYVVPNDNVQVVDEVTISRWDKVLSLLSMPWIFPLFTARFKWKLCRRYQHIIDQGEYDYVYFDFSQTFSYAAVLRHPHKILMAHDVIEQKYSRIQTYNHAWAKFSERMVLRHGEAVFTFSPKDCDLLTALYGVASQPTSFFLSRDVVAAEPGDVGNYVVMFGSWNREENYEPLAWVMDNVIERLPEGMMLKVVGGGKMPTGLQQRLESSERVEYLGFVDNPYPIIANAVAELAPLQKGAGVKVKCVEALGCGTPIVGTEVAFEGISERFADFMVLARTPDEIVSAIGQKHSKEKRLAFKARFCKEYRDTRIIKYITGGNVQS